MSSNDTALAIISPNSFNPSDKFEKYLLSVTLNWATIIVGTPMTYQLTAERFVVVVIVSTMTTCIIIYLIISTLISVIKIVILKLLHRRKIWIAIKNLRGGDDDIFTRIVSALVGDDITRLMDTCIEPGKVYEIIFMKTLNTLLSRDGRRLILSRTGLLTLDILLRSGTEVDISILTNAINVKAWGRVISTRFSNRSVLITLAFKRIGLGAGGIGLLYVAIRIFGLSLIPGLGATALAVVLTIQVGLVPLANDVRLMDSTTQCTNYVPELPKFENSYLINGLNEWDKNDAKVSVVQNKNIDILEGVQSEGMESNQEYSDNIFDGPIRKRDSLRRFVKRTKNNVFGFFNFKKKVEGFPIDGVIYQRVEVDKTGQDKILDRYSDLDLKTHKATDLFKAIDKVSETYVESELKTWISPFTDDTKVTTEPFTRATTSQPIAAAPKATKSKTKKARKAKNAPKANPNNARKIIKVPTKVTWPKM